MKDHSITKHPVKKHSQLCNGCYNCDEMLAQVMAHIENGDIKAKPLTFDHKPENAQVQQSLMSAGICVNL